MSEYDGQDLIEIPEPEESVDLSNVLFESGDAEPEVEAIPEVEALDDGEGEGDKAAGEPVVDDNSTSEKTGDEPSEEGQAQQSRKRKDPQKRINALSRKAKEAEERAAAAEAKLALIEEEKFENERQAKEQELLERRKEAAENADLDVMFDVTDELNELRSKKPNSDNTSQDELDAGEVASNEEADEPAPMADSAKAWIERNTWFDDPDNADLAKAAMDVENTLRQRGYELGDELYEAIDKVIANDPRFEDVRPEVVADELASEPADKPEKPAAPQRPNIPVTTTKASQTNEEANQSGRLSKFDIKTMRNFNLDPENPKHRKAFLDRKH